jgi:hypothetical protein
VLTNCRTYLRRTEANFVIRIRDGNTEWANVQTGEVDGKLAEVFGDLHEGDEVATRETDELHPGIHVTAKGSYAKFPRIPEMIGNERVIENKKEHQ